MKNKKLNDTSCKTYSVHNNKKNKTQNIRLTKIEEEKSKQEAKLNDR